MRRQRVRFPKSELFYLKSNINNMKEFNVEVKESFKDCLQKYLNNRCLVKPRRSRPVNAVYTNKGVPAFQGFMPGTGSNYAVIFSPKRKKLKGWQKH